MKNIRLIGAGAGSGKTYRLSMEVLHGIEAKAFRPQGIMLTTFTRRAASELRGRVSARLIEKGKVEESQLLGQSLIGTVHGICATLLKDYAFECGLPMEQNVLDPDDAAGLFRRALANGIAYDDQEVISRIAYTIELEDWQKTVQQLADLVRINQIDPQSLDHWAGRSVETLFSGFKEVPNGRLELLEEITSYQNLLAETVSNNTDSTNVTKECIEALKKALKQLKRTEGIRWKDIQAVCSKDPAKRNPHYEGMAGIQKLANQNFAWPEVRRDIYDVTSRLFKAVGQALAAYATLKIEIGAVDYVDLEVMFLKALENPTVRDRLAARIDVLMVDEFQDTSPTQMAIFLKMSEFIRQVIWVGDPKQAIFGFRGTDPDLMMSAMTEISKLRTPERLELSWRSRPELVQFVNQAFKDVFKAIQQSPGDVMLQPSRPQELESPFLESWVLTKVEGENGGRSKQNVETDQLQIASRIKEILEKKEHPVLDRESRLVRKIEPRDIAILVRANPTAAALAKTMRALQIPCEVAIAGLLQETEVRCVLAAVNYLLDPRDRFSAGQLVYLHDIYLGDNTTNDQWLSDGIAEEPFLNHAVLTRLKAYADKARGMAPMAIFDLAVEQSGALDVSHAHQIPHIAKYNIEQLRYTIREFLARQLANGKSTTMRAALAYLAERAKAEQDRIQPAAANAVQIVTYHAAKGLEWPMVILYELHKQYEAAPFDARIVTPDVIDIKWPLRDRGVIYWPYVYGRLGRKQNTEFAFLDTVEETSEYGTMARKRLEEETRLLYVAMTRARDYLVFAARKGALQALEVLKTEDGACTVTVPQSTGPTTSGWRVLEPKIAKSPLNIDRTGDLIAFAYRPRPPFKSGRLTPSRAVIEVVDGGRMKIGSTEVYGKCLSISTTVEDAIVGNALHACLAVDLSTIPGTARNIVVQDILASSGLRDGLASSDVMVQLDLWNGVLRTRWPDARLLREAPVFFNIDGVVAKGFADLVLDTKDGMIIVDHKSFRGGPELFAKKALSYAGQLNLYREIVQKASKKPVVGCFINFFSVGAMVELIM